MQMLHDVEQPAPCRVCGGINFDLQPKKHSQYGYSLTKEDRVFLLVQGIDPENPEDDCA
jgi:hypothetical protein